MLATRPDRARRARDETGDDQRGATAAPMRTIILHYHLFKNAGTSLDRILQRNFGPGWVTREFTGQNNTQAVTDWIREMPQAVAFSSHTMMGPLPRIPGVRIVSVMLLRDPLERIRSAYRFERRQEADTFGAVLAKHTDLEGYVKVRLALPHDRQCRNFQTWRLASLEPGPAPAPEPDRALAALERLSVVGLVREFGAAVAALRAELAPVWPGFEAGEVHANRSAPEGGSEAGTDEPPALTRLMQETNADDMALIAELERRQAGAAGADETGAGEAGTDAPGSGEADAPPAASRAASSP